MTSRTRFLALNEPDEMDAFRLTAHYMNFALAAYGWPMYLLGHSTTGLCLLCSRMKYFHIPTVLALILTYDPFRCCCCVSNNADAESEPEVVGDTCSGCHLTALRQACGSGDHQVTYASFHVDVAETPFFVAVDYDHRAVVVSIRGTISMKDVITDLHAEAEPIPLREPIEDWLGHKVSPSLSMSLSSIVFIESLFSQSAGEIIIGRTKWRRTRVSKSRESDDEVLAVPCVFVFLNAGGKV